MGLNNQHVDVMKAIEKGATIWGYIEAKMLREVEAHDPELITIVTVAEMELMTGQEYDGAGRLPYFGAILTKKGKEFVNKNALSSRQA